MSPWRPLLGLLSWCPIFKSSRCNWFEDRTSRFHLRLPDLQMRWRDLITWQGIWIEASAMGVGRCTPCNYNDTIMGAMASQITGVSIVYLTVNSDADQGKHQSSASLAFVRGIHRLPVNSPHKGPVTRELFPFDDVSMWFGEHGEYLKSFDTLMYKSRVPFILPRQALASRVFMRYCRLGCKVWLTH